VLTLFMLMLLVGASPPGGAFVFAGLALGTAAVGAILALVQDNARSLLSWASISHMGFIAVGIATATDAGWVSAIQATTVHFLCFLILFRLTRPGALDNNRVISTTALLIAVATLSGLPPFSGFVPRWYVLQSMFEREWYWHAGLGAVVSLVSLGYLFRLVRLALHGRPITPDAFTDRPGLMDLVLAAACATGLVGLALFPDVLTVPATGYTATLFAGSRPVQEPLSRALAGWARGWYRYPLVAVLLGGSVWYSLVPRKPSAGASALRIRGINILRSSWLTDFWVGLGDVVARAGSIVARLAAVRNRMYAFITVGCTVLLYVVIAVVR
jgi:NADH:ubiquinone oxidoreductase subunit 5 (subunit L)/multisubunit Na+/H+ antiporter MnhA subunit